MVSTSLLSTEFSLTSALHSSLTDQFKQVVDRFPQKTAITDQHTSLSYQELWDRAVELSFSMNSLSGQSLVSIESGNSTEHIVAIWATLLAGHSYIFLPPLDNPKLSTDLLGISASLSIDETGSRLTIHEKEVNSTYQPHESPGTERHSQSAACVVMTSGSTGEPKLVVFEDQHIVFESWRQNLDTGLCPEDKMDLLFSFHFSASLACIFPALLTGASLHLLDLAKEGWAILPEWWRQHEITIANLSTATFRKLIAMKKPIFVPGMKMLGIGAEAMNQEDVKGFLTFFPNTCELQQSYASTEARTISQWFLRKHGWDPQKPVPVGYPVTGKQLSILHPDGSPVNPGEMGEIFIESEFIPETYWNPKQISWRKYLQRTDRQQRKIRTGDVGFISPTGSLVLTGRKDFQLKIRGQKVSPEWVENLLKARTILAQISVADHQEYGYIGVLGPEISQEQMPWIHSVSLSLPSHMRPAKWIQFNEWPTNRNGKFDRPAIMSMPGTATTLLPEIMVQNKAEMSPSISTVVGLIEEVLGLQNTSPIADFFDELGGDSLIAVEVWGSVLDIFSISAPFELMHQLKTAEAIGNWIDDQTEKSDFVLLSEGKTDLPPIICLSPIGTAFNCYQPLVSCWDGPQSLIGLLTQFGNESTDLSELAEKSRQTLEARFPTGPITLCGFSYAGIMAVELGKKLIAQGRHVDIILIDTPTYRPTSLSWKLLSYPLKKLKKKAMKVKSPKNGIAAQNPAAKLPSFYKQQLHLLKGFSPIIDNPTGIMIVFEALSHTQPGFHYKRDMNWEKWVSGKIRKYALPTTHNKIAKSPWIEEVSRVIQLLIPSDHQPSVSEPARPIDKKLIKISSSLKAIPDAPKNHRTAI